ncbi:MAG TPA: glycosyltransferase [Longimicrobiales bacterium]
MRALIVTNMYPTPQRPARGRFVYDQVQALRKLADVEIFSFDGAGSIGAYVRAGRALRERYLRSERFDVVHAHFGLTAWPALALPARARAVTLHGTDLAHPRSRLITAAALGAYDLVATVSEPLADSLPRLVVRGRRAVLPCGVDLERFVPIPRRAARERLGLDSERSFVLFPADPGRPEKRYDRAKAVADASSIPLHALGAVDPELVPYWVNAANAVLVPSEREGFGLAVLEALACDVPVLATPVGIHPEALANVTGTMCGEFDVARWRTALAPHLQAVDPRVAGRASAERYSSDRMAQRVLEAWQSLA